MRKFETAPKLKNIRYVYSRQNQYEQWNYEPYHQQQYYQEPYQSICYQFGHHTGYPDQWSQYEYYEQPTYPVYH